MSSPMHRPSLFARLADRFGATASFLCAAHCALLPLVLALLPALGLGFLADHRFERGFIAFACLLALSSLIVGFRRHQRFRAFGFLAPGIALLFSGIVFEYESTIVHAALVATGGSLVALAHVINLRLAHGHVHNAACGH